MGESASREFYVLAGTYAFLLDGATVEATAGAHVFVSRGSPHTFWNAGSTDATCLIVRSPAAFAPYIRELAEALATADSEDAARSVRRRLSERYDMEVVGS